MRGRFWVLSEDLSPTVSGVVLAICAVSMVFLALELRRRERFGISIAITGFVACALLACALLRPARVTTRGTLVGPRVAVLVDQSRRLLLPAEGGTRRQRALVALQALKKHFGDVRLDILGFGEGQPTPLDTDVRGLQTRLRTNSDLVSALSGLSSSAGERPEAVVVVSDGRLSAPADGVTGEALNRAVGVLSVPLHTVSVSSQEPRDASIRAVKTTGSAVAHQTLPLTLELGCAGLECTEAPVTVRELLHGEEPFVLATGVAKFEKGSATVQLNVTLERAGPCVVEVTMRAPPGDTIPENDTRVLTFNVTRDRIRLLHVAGHPSYDARALRRWLKSDESLDLVAFFILRTEGDDPQASDSDLALIPFPVDDLFQGEPLRSFDAVVLQDIDSVEYKFAKYLDPLARYVRAGGGLVMVGGASSFTAGGYAGTKLEQVLPVHLDQRERPFDGVEFVPRYTESGRQAPVLHALRALVGDQLPSMAGSNTLGPAREGALVLWEHPERRAGGEPMPVLALGEAGDGRAIALGVDGTHLLAFSQMAAAVAGRGYGALWDGLLRWLMRDPRVEAARMELVGECIAGEPATLRLVRTAGATGSVRLRLEQLGVETTKPLEFAPKADATGSIEVDLGRLKPGGYTVSARIGAAPPTRYDFACERGGQAWSDSRPDPARLERISKATGGRAVSVESVGDLPLPAATEVTAERHVSPLLPPWAWTLMAALALGGHWFVRRRGGLA